MLKTQLDGVEEQIKRTEKEVEIGNRPKSDIYDIKANMGTLQEQWYLPKIRKEISKNNLLNALAITSDNIDFAQNTSDTSSVLAFSDENFVKEMLEKNPCLSGCCKGNSGFCRENQSRKKWLFTNVERAVFVVYFL